MQKVLVTGGAGFIGSHTVVALHEAGYDPVIVDNFVNSERFVMDRLHELTGKHFTLYEADCTDRKAMQNVCDAEKELVGVIHFAAYKQVNESVEKPLKYYHNNVGGLEVLLGLMHQNGMRNLVFSSSCTVYGQPDDLPVTEQSPVLPAHSPYGRSKQICEDMISDVFKSGIPLNAAVLRYFNPIGAHPSGLIGELPIGVPQNLVPFITQTAAQWREQLTVFGSDYNTPDGTCIRDFIHVCDLAEAHVAALQWLLQQGAHNKLETVNLGTGNGTSVLEAVNAFEEGTGLSLNYQLGERRVGDIAQIWADTNKAKSVFGWETKRSLITSMQDAWRWQQTLQKPD